MSYCRFSSNDFQCDLYVYDDIAGYISIGVASRRPIPIQPLPPPVPLTQEGHQAWLERYNYVYDICFAEGHEWEPVNPKWAGQTFQITDPEEAATLIEEMMRDGIQAPAELPQWIREGGMSEAPRKRIQLKVRIEGLEGEKGGGE